MSAAFPNITIRRAATADTLDALVYCAAPGHAVEFGCRAATPVDVWIPRGRWWSERVPDWAQEQRESIVAGVRGWGAIVHETELDANGVATTTIQAPDGTFRIECTIEPDDRAAPWERTRIVAATGDVLAFLPLHAVSGPIDFPRRGAVDLNLLGRFGDRVLLHVDIQARTFRRDADPESLHHRLSAIDAILAPPRAPVPVRSSAVQRPAFDALMIALGVPFALGGSWLALSGHTLSDRLAGVTGMLLGGFTAATAIGARRGRTRRVPAENVMPVRSGGTRWAPFVPLLAVIAQVVWLGILLLGFLFTVGDRPYVHTPGSPMLRAWDLIAMLPALAGLMFGIGYVARGRAHRPLDRLWLLGGSVGCALFVFVFVRDFFH